MTAQHTPGPWRAGDPNFSDGMIRVHSVPADRNVAGVFVSEFDVPEDEANACLIAAAPALLAALRFMASHYTPYRVEGGDPVLNQARAALAQAEGQG